MSAKTTAAKHPRGRDKDRIILLLLGLGLLLLTSAVHGNNVLDDTGQAIPIQPDAQRVLTLSPHTTDIMLSIGGLDKLVAAASHSVDLPKQIPRIATFGGIDREQILSLKPDLVIAWVSGNRASDLAWLKQQGIRVFHSEPKNVQQLVTSMRAMGKLLKRTGQANAVANRFMQNINKACDKNTRQTAYLNIWDKPAMTVGGQHWLNDVLRYAGLTNSYKQVRRGVFSVEAESLAGQQNLTHINIQQVPNDALSRPGPQLVEAIRYLCAK